MTPREERISARLAGPGFQNLKRNASKTQNCRAIKTLEMEGTYLR